MKIHRETNKITNTDRNTDINADTNTYTKEDTEIIRLVNLRGIRFPARSPA